MHRKRRSRGYRKPHRGGVKPNFAPVIVILCLSVGCGYATARYVVDPVVNYVPQLKAEKEQSQETDIVEDDVKTESTGEISGYALQFGCYSSKDAAESVASSLGDEDLQVLEQNGMYKIVGRIYDTKDKAKEALNALENKEKAFVTTIYK